MNYSRGRHLAAVILFVCALCTAQELSAADGVDIRYALAANVSAARIERDIRTLVNFGTRHTLSETESDTRGIGAARRWIEAEFKGNAEDFELPQR